MMVLSKLKLSQSRLITSIILAAILVVVIWYPFGFSLGGMIEEWGFIHLFQQLPDAWSSFPGKSLAEGQVARPLQRTVFYVAYAIDSHSFFGFHVLLIASCLLRVIAGCSIGFWLFRQRGYAVLLGVLCLVFPADTQQISLRTMNISIASTLMLVATTLMLMALTRQKSMARLILAGSATVASCVATLTYEPVFTLYALCPLLVVLRLGFRTSLSFVHRRLIVWIMWSAGPVFNAAYLWYALVIKASKYQADAIRGSTGFLHNAHYLWTSAAYRIFFDGWRSCWNILTEEVGNRWLFAAAALAFIGILTALVETKAKRQTAIYLSRVVLVGIVLCIVAYVPYMISEAHMVISQRTFLSAAFGASMVFVAATALVFRGAPIVGAAVGSLLAYAGLVSQLYQHDQYARLYTGVIRPYMAIVADRIDLGKPVHLIKDHSGFGGYLNGIFFTNINSGIPARLNDTEGSYFLCLDEPFSAKPLFHCDLEGSTWTVTSNAGGQWRYPNSDVDVVEMGRRFDTRYRARNSNWRDLGSFSREESLFNRRDSPDVYYCRADSDWGYTRFCRGEGWGSGAPSTSMSHQNAFAPIAHRGTLLFDLMPASEMYNLRVSLLRGKPSSLKFEINGAPLDISVSGKILSAAVPPALLVSGLNEIAISNAHGLAPAPIAITKVELAPRSKMSAAPPDDTPEMPVDRWIAASDDGGYSYLAEGFSGPEPPRGVWTDGDTAVIRFRAPAERNIDHLDLDVIPYLDEIHPSLDADVRVNQGSPIHLSFAVPAKRDVITIPVSANQNDPGLVEVTISIKDPRRPQSTDPRYLGLFVALLRIH
jgi:hypothetical protein